MKFIHTADLHYGMKPDIGKPWSAERAQAVKDALASIVRAARDEKVDLLLIAGDLFHHQPLVRDLKEISYLFASIPDVAVAVIAGNHDRIRDNSAVLSFPWPKNVYYFTESSLSSVYLRRINTEVYGFSYHTREIRDNLLEGVEAPESVFCSATAVTRNICRSMSKNSPKPVFPTARSGTSTSPKSPFRARSPGAALPNRST